MSLLSRVVLACLAATALFGSAVPAALAQAPRTILEQGLRIPMRDGVELVADVFRPAGLARHPVIVELTPYGRGDPARTFRAEADYWVEHGYVFVLVDVRGQGDSGGRFEWFTRDEHDGYDVVEWLAQQAWSSGKVGMRGSSYTGTNQWFVARGRPPHLACITPSATVRHPFNDLPYPGGTFNFNWGLTWISGLPDSGIAPGTPIDWPALLAHRPLATADERAFGRPLSLYREFLAHPTFDAYWQRRHLAPRDYAAIDIPTLAFSGWFDGTLRGTMQHYRAIRAHSPVRDRHWLVVGPWEHLTAPDGGLDFRTGAPVDQVGDLRLPRQAFLPGRDITRRFFDDCLKGGPPFEQSPVRLYLTGSNRWVDLPTYPARSVEPRKLYLRSAGAANGLSGDGRLDWRAPLAEPPDQYVYDPRNPALTAAPDAARGPVGRVSWPIDLAPFLDRDDTLVYLSEPLSAPLSIAGPVQLVLHAASDARDTDFFSNLEDVAPDGRAVKLGSGNGAGLRARYRDGFARERLLVPGKPVVLTLDFFDIGHTFQPGHRLRISVTSSSWPWTHPNPNTGHPIATDTAPPRPARQTIFHDRSRPSHLLLPVMPEP
jgi:uncharacterized protein